MAMRYATFMTTVQQAAGITREEAERAVPATLQTLAERISGGEAGDIAGFLPRELRPLLTAASEQAQPFDLDELLRRVAGRESVDRATAAEHARAVFVALGAAVAPGELRDMAAQLPRDFDGLLEAAGVGRGQAMADDDLVLRVAELAGWSDREQARRATEAVLETLAERISDGEVDDLMVELPGTLRPALERGLRESRAAKVMTADEFVARVADREGVDLDEAEQHVCIVFTALREAISPKEFSDVVAQLSRDYASLLAR
jgi:uncharacterized protein (DUF2267 family)